MASRPPPPPPPLALLFLTIGLFIAFAFELAGGAADWPVIGGTAAAMCDLFPVLGA